MIPMRSRFLVAVPLLLLSGACDQIDRVRGREQQAPPPPAASATAGPLMLGLTTPGAIAHGEEGILRLTLSNRGDTVARGVRVELLVPEWMEPMPPRPGDPEVTMAATDEAQTRFAYRIQDSLVAGETKVVEQRIRVAPAPADGALTWSRLVRARLLSASGQAIAEVESEVSLSGTPGADTTRVAQPAAPRDRLGPVRLGLGAAALRQAVAGSRDTTWSAEGTEERGVVVPLDGGARVLAVIAGDSVHRIEVRDPAVRTQERVGVGSRLADLRSAYGRTCAAVGEGTVVVWFPSAPGISFALDAPIPANPATIGEDPERIPGTARVTRWWLRRGTEACPSPGSPATRG
jgi:hypothetical protein